MLGFKPRPRILIPVDSLQSSKAKGPSQYSLKFKRPGGAAAAVDFYRVRVNESTLFIYDESNLVNFDDWATLALNNYLATKPTDTDMSQDVYLPVNKAESADITVYAARLVDQKPNVQLKTRQVALTSDMYAVKSSGVSILKLPGTQADEIVTGYTAQNEANATVCVNAVPSNDPKAVAFATMSGPCLAGVGKGAERVLATIVAIPKVPSHWKPAIHEEDEMMRMEFGPTGMFGSKTDVFAKLTTYPQYAYVWPQEEQVANIALFMHFHVKSSRTVARCCSTACRRSPSSRRVQRRASAPRWAPMPTMTRAVPGMWSAVRARPRRRRRAAAGRAR